MGWLSEWLTPDIRAQLTQVVVQHGGRLAAETVKAMWAPPAAAEHTTTAPPERPVHDVYSEMQDAIGAAVLDLHRAIRLGLAHEGHRVANDRCVRLQQEREAAATRKIVRALNAGSRPEMLLDPEGSAILEQLNALAGQATMSPETRARALSRLADRIATMAENRTPDVE